MAQPREAPQAEQSAQDDAPRPESEVRSKLSTKTMGLNGKKGAVLDKDGEIVWLGHIYGFADGVKVKTRTDDHGAIVTDHPITGDFEGVNLETGEMFSSSMLYLPGGFHDIMETALKNTATKNDKGDITGYGRIEFGVLIGSQKSSNKAGFEWVGKNLVKTAGADPLKNLRSQIAATLAGQKGKLALIAPKAK